MRLESSRIGQVLPSVLKRTSQQHGVLWRIQRKWPRLVGRALAAHTVPVSLRRGQLVILVDRPGDGFALGYKRTQLLERLEAEARGGVREIIMRPGEMRMKRKRG